MIKYAVGGIVGGIALGVIIDRIVIYSVNKKKTGNEKILEKCFGEPMYTSFFSMSEVRDWIKSREEMLKSGAKAIVLKVNSDTLHRIGQNLDIRNTIKNYIIIAIVDEREQSIPESVLIKYETLERNLDEALDKSQGVLVVEV